jgi:hypothetical protein
MVRSGQCVSSERKMKKKLKELALQASPLNNELAPHINLLKRKRLSHHDVLLIFLPDVLETSRRLREAEAAKRFVLLRRDAEAAKRFGTPPRASSAGRAAGGFCRALGSLFWRLLLLRQQ